ncbi:MAG: DUF2946 family protein [Micropepsaceae bacterium]
MMQTLRSSRVLRALVLLAFAVRAIIPSGYMINSTPESGVMVVLCSAHGLLAAKVDPVTGEVSFEKKAPSNHSDKDDAPCAFSAIAKVAPPSTNFVFDAPRELAALVPLPSQGAAPGRGLTAPPPPSTGPPAHPV